MCESVFFKENEMIKVKIVEDYSTSFFSLHFEVL